MNFLYNAFPEFEFFEDDGSELFHDASPMKKTKKKLYGPFLWTRFNYLKARATTR